VEPADLNSPVRTRRSLPLIIGVAVVCVLLAGSLMVRRAESKTNKVALSETAKPVSVIAPQRVMYSASRLYIGTIEPWVEARVGPQLVSAYVDSVLVRPGAVVKKGDVLATLDCRNTNATSRAVAMQARALETHQKAVANEASRVRGLLDGGFVSPNEAEQSQAHSASELAGLLAQQAKLLGSSLEVNDCVLRAPFSGEVATRSVDPGGFVRPGVAIVSIVDRSTLRIVADAPEVDFQALTPGSEVRVHVLTTNQDVRAVIARRAPSADPATRTIHFELDVPDPAKAIPVNTTAEIQIDVGKPTPALEIPLSAAAVRGSRVSLFVVEHGIAHARVLPLQGERAGKLFLAPQLPAGSRVVTEGRALLAEGDHVIASDEPQAAASPVAGASL
jgi:membrane fusion protein, multidrug efflux system